jgi:microcin C transport system permease protein
MLAYIIRRLLLIFPTLFGIMALNFLVIQSAPDGPVEQLIQQLRQCGAPAVTDWGSDGAASGEMERSARGAARDGYATSRYPVRRSLDQKHVGKQPGEGPRA